jgi:glucan phosphoethanolaminetransferase (alkaline phosphatase superfamily)
MKNGLLVLLFPILFALSDVFIRFSLIKLYSTKQLFFYLLSVIASTLFFVLVTLVLNTLKTRAFLFNLILALFSSYLVVSILGSYSFFYLNGFFPNYYTYEYFKNEPLSALVLIKDSVNFFQLFILLCTNSGVFILLRKLCLYDLNLKSKRWIISLFALYLGVFSILVVKLKKYDQCLLVDTNFSAAVTRHIIDWETERKFTGKGLGERKPILLQKTVEKRDFNVLVVVFESLRKQNLEAYGYKRKTTPNFTRFSNDHPSEFFVFKHPYTVSSTTMLAVPAVLSGIAPYQDPKIFYSQPILWDFAKMLNYRNFFASSHSLEWYRFDRFYKNEKVDQLWCKETSGMPFFNDLGVDDKYTIAHVNSLIRKKSEKPFFGIVQLNSTHYPYNVPKEFVKWSGSFQDEYDNAILYQDYVISKLFSQLKKSGKLENTVIIFTSDHGESLKDHNNIGHVDSYYAETISVPLMLYLPKGIATHLDRKMLRENSSKTTSNIDVAPTVISLLGLTDNKEVGALLKNYSGYSLFTKIPKDRALITMNNNKIARFKVGISIIRGNLHYIHRTNIVPNREEMYDIKKDKKEARILPLNRKHMRIKELMNCFKQYPLCTKYLPQSQLR